MARPKKAAAPPGFVQSNETAGRTSFVPALGATTRQTPPTKVAAAPPYLLKAHPDRLTICGDAVVPQFGRMVIQPGINGVSDIGGKLRTGDAEVMAKESGWIIIPPTAIPDHHATPGQPKSYLYNPEGRPDVTLLIYENCYPGSDRVDRDTPRFLEFCDYLIESAIIPPPKLYALHKLREKLVKDRDDLSDKTSKNPSNKSALTIAQSHVDVVEAVIAEREASEAPTPSRRSAAALPSVDTV